MTKGYYWRCVKCHYAHDKDYCPECGYHTKEQEDFPQPKQEQGEPVAWMQDSIELYVQDHPNQYYTIPLYTTPQQRTWVGLDLDERAACYEASGGNLSKFADAVEAKLREKNT